MTEQHTSLPSSEPALATLLENLPGVVYRCLNRPDWPMQFLSQGCEELTGYAPEQLVMNAELAFGDLLHPDDRERVWREVQIAIEGQRPFTLEYRIITASGQERLVWERGRAVVDEHGTLLSIEGFIQDISDRAELERRTVQAQKLEAMGQLAGGVVHDINNMLMVIRSFLDLGLMERAGQADDDWMQPALRAVERGAQLTKQLMTIARQQATEQGPVELNALLEGFRGMIGTLLGRGVQLELRCSPDPVWVHGDAGQLEQVLMNLCINARDAMPKGGRLGLSCRLGSEEPEGAREAVIEVTDTGTGIEPAIQAEIFAPFFTTKDAERGTGLGLSTVASIVQQHHGRVRLHSVPGEGSRFEVWLPSLER
jgi:two-component system cell cycle sensor histidine kinase/response regulator CckA